MEPLPSLTKVFGMIVQQERRSDYLGSHLSTIFWFQLSTLRSFQLQKPTLQMGYSKGMLILLPYQSYSGNIQNLLALILQSPTTPITISTNLMNTHKLLGFWILDFGFWSH
ncbi:hypothetical protein CR513_14292, partial [Mucuna pruriens]